MRDEKKHIRAFASEVLVAMTVLALFVQLVLKPARVLDEHIECFRCLHGVLHIFKKARTEDIPKARELNQKHHAMF